MSYEEIDSLPGFDQYLAEDKLSCFRTQRRASGEARSRNPSVSSQALYNWATALSFVCFDSLRPSQQFLSHVGTGLPELDQYLAEDKLSYSRTQRRASGVALTRNHLISGNHSTAPLRPRCMRSTWWKRKFSEMTTFLR